MAVTLKLADLREILREAGVPDSAYSVRRRFGSLRRPSDGTWCVERAADGWQVYQWLDDGKQHLTITSTEESACDVLLGELGFGNRNPGLRQDPRGGPPE